MSATSLQDKAISVSLAAQLQFSGRDIVYHRGSKSETIEAIADNHVAQAVAADGTIVGEAERHDFVFPLSSLAGFSPAEPAREDWIEAFGLHWEITEQPGAGWWKYADPARRWVRVRVTQTQ